MSDRGKCMCAEILKQNYNHCICFFIIWSERRYKRKQTVKVRILDARPTAALKGSC